MENALLIGLSRQIALSRELDVVANNIANINTTGYKADGSLFEEYLSSAARSGQNQGRVSFVHDRGTWHDLSAGPIEQTGNPLDVAIDGNAFLVVQTPRGERYTRNGALQINGDGQLVTSDGDAVLGDAGPIQFQPTDNQVSISRDGTITVREGTSKADSARGKLRLVTFDDAAAIAEGRQQHLHGRRRCAAAADQGIARHPGRDREIERARRRRDVAHDRDHAHLHPDRGDAAAADRPWPAGDRQARRSSELTIEEI